MLPLFGKAVAMRLYLGHESAIEYWRAVGCGLAPTPEPSSIRAVTDEAVGRKEIAKRAPQLDLAHRPPIHALTSKREAIHSSRGIERHLCKQVLPDGAFYRISDDVLVASPALCLLQAAQRTKPDRLLPLIELCMEFLGGYSLCEGTKRGFRQHEPFLDTDTLDTFTAALPLNTRGSRMLADAAGFALPRSWSPRETASSLMLTLPETYGGFAFPWPDLNKQVEIKPEFRRFTDNSTFFLDLWWPRTSVAFEYDGADHSDPEQIAADKARRNLLATMGYQLIVVEKAHIDDAHLFNQQIGQLAKLLGITLTAASDEIAAKRTKLRRYLFNPRHLSLWKVAKPIELLPVE